MTRASLINKVADKINKHFKASYEEIVEKMQEIGFFESWDEWELNHRPVNEDEIIYILSQNLE